MLVARTRAVLPVAMDCCSPKVRGADFHFVGIATNGTIKIIQMALV
jgi:hypothetical protein